MTDGVAERTTRVPHLGPLEQQVMDVLWRSCEAADEPLTIRAVVDRMPGLAYTTVATVLNNLSRKGMVEQLRDEPVLRYRPHRGRAQHFAWVMTEVLDSAVNREQCLATFIDGLRSEDIDVLKQLLVER